MVHKELDVARIFTCSDFHKKHNMDMVYALSTVSIMLIKKISSMKNVFVSDDSDLIMLSPEFFACMCVCSFVMLFVQTIIL